MPRRPDFYRFFYRATRERQFRAGTERHTTGSRPVLAAPLDETCSPSRGARSTLGGRSSGSLGVGSEPQRQIPAGRRGIVGLVACSMSPTGSIRGGL
jgi:hypothetical protein